MKRFLVFAALTAASLLGSAPTADAAWVNKEIFWQISSQGSPNNASAIYIRDTSFTVVQGVATALDTTGDFSLDAAVPLLRGQAAATGATSALAASQSDTTIVGYLVFQVDSTVAGTATVTSITVLIDGTGPGGAPPTDLANGWVRCDSMVVNSVGTNGQGQVSSGDESIHVPIRTIGPYGNNLRFAKLRARTLAVTGILSGSVRVWLRYWKPS